MRLTSSQNPRLKLAAKLRDSRGRQRQQRIIIDGKRALGLAMAAGVLLEELFLEQSDFDELPADDVAWIESCKAAGTQIFTLPANVLQRIAYRNRSDQWVGTAAMPRRSLSDLLLTEMPAIAILEGVEKPGNVGAVLRTADATGIDALIIADGRTDLFNPNAIRASLGTIFTVSIATGTTQEVAAWLKEHSIATYVARVDGAADYRSCDFRQPCAIVLGSEAEGVSERWLATEWQGTRLPMQGQADSLNVSNTAAVLFYELFRQRGKL